MDFKKRKYTNISYLFIGMIVIIFLVFLSINAITPLIGEDFVLIAFSRSNKPSSINELLIQIIKRIYIQMTTWNVRIGEQLSIILSVFNKSVFNVFNSIMSLLYIYLIYIYAFKKRISIKEKNDIFAIFLIACLIFLFQPAFGEIFFWRTGSTNYLWGINLLLFYALPLRFYVGKVRFNLLQNKKILIIIHTIAGFFAGLTNENTVIVFIMLYVLVIIYDKIMKKQTPKWIYSSFSTLFIGFIFMLKAPSTIIRIQTYKEMFGINYVTLVDYIYRACHVIKSFFGGDNLRFVIVLLVTLFIYLVLMGKNRNTFQMNNKYMIIDWDYEPLAFLLLSSLSAGALIMSPYIETRAFLLIDFFMCMCIVYYSIRIIEMIKNCKDQIVIFISIILMFATIFEYRKIYITYSDYYRFTISREKELLYNTNNGESYIWNGFNGPLSTRILTTREDYLSSNIPALNYYYGANIVFLNGANDTITTTTLKDNSIIGSIDCAIYNEKNKKLEVWGWAAFDGVDSNQTSIKIILKIGDNSYYFTPEVVERKDVSDYYETNLYDNTGFHLCLSNFDVFIEDINDIKIGVSLENEKIDVNGECILNTDIIIE